MENLSRRNFMKYVGAGLASFGISYGSLESYSSEPGKSEIKKSSVSSKDLEKMLVGDWQGIKPQPNGRSPNLLLKFEKPDENHVGRYTEARARALKDGSRYFYNINKDQIELYQVEDIRLYNMAKVDEGYKTQKATIEETKDGPVLIMNYFMDRSGKNITEKYSNKKE